MNADLDFKSTQALIVARSQDAWLTGARLFVTITITIITTITNTITNPNTGAILIYNYSCDFFYNDHDYYDVLLLSL